MTMVDEYGRPRCIDCEGVVRGAIAELCDDPRCYDCRRD